MSHRCSVVLPDHNPLDNFLQNTQYESGESVLYDRNTDVNLPLRQHPHTSILLRRTYADQNLSFIDVIQHPNINMDLSLVYKMKPSEYNSQSIDDGRTVLRLHPRQFMEDHRVQVELTSQNKKKAAEKKPPKGKGKAAAKGKGKGKGKEKEKEPSPPLEDENPEDLSMDDEDEDEGEEYSIPSAPRFFHQMIPMTSACKDPPKPGKGVSLLTRLTESGALEVLEYAIALGRADYLVDGEDPKPDLAKAKLRKLKDSTRKLIKIASQAGQTTSGSIASLWTEFRESRFLLVARLLTKLSLDGIPYKFWQAVMDNNNAHLHELLHTPESYDVNWKEPTFLRTPFYLACVRGNLQAVKWFLSDPRTNVNAPDHWERGPFYMACLHGHTEVVRLLMAEPKVDRYKCSTQGSTPLLAACIRGSAELVAMLLADTKFDRNRSNIFMESPLLIAFKCKNFPVLKLLLADPRTDVNKPGRLLETLFLKVCEAGNEEIFDLLLRNPHLDVNRFDHLLQTPLFRACSSGRASVVKALLRIPRLDFHQKAQHFSPFQVACHRGHAEVVELLLEDSRFETDPMQPVLESPLVLVCKTGNSQVLEALLKSPKMTITPALQRASFLEACKQRASTLAEMFLTHPRIQLPLEDEAIGSGFTLACKTASLPVMELLIKRALPVLPAATLFQAFNAACVDASVAVAKCLLESVPNLEINGMNGSSPFASAINSYCPTIAAMIASDPRFDVNFSSSSTPLVTASRSGFINLVLILLKKPGVHITQVDCRNRFPLLAAAECGYITITKLLLALTPLEKGPLSAVQREFYQPVLDALEDHGRHELLLLMESFVADPHKVVVSLREKLFINGEYAAETFASLVYLCDGILSIKEGMRNTPQARFLRMASKLPLELQMILCNRLNNRTSDLIPAKEREESFKNVAKDLQGVLRQPNDTLAKLDDAESREYSDSESSDEYSDEYGHYGHSDLYDEDEDEDGYDYDNMWPFF